MPLMKPFVHYIQAQISGREIPESRRPSRSATISHSWWHVRFWTPRTHRATTDTGDHHVWPSRAKSRPLVDEDRFPKQPYCVGAHVAPVKDGAPKSVSLELPMYGLSEDDCTDDLYLKHHPIRWDDGSYEHTEEIWDRQESVWNLLSINYLTLMTQS